MKFPKRCIDQMSYEVSLTNPATRIISLVPSQTELLFDLGLTEEVVGITKFCIHPEAWFRSKARVGGTKEFDFEKIAALQPDLIIGNKEENEEQQIKQLQSQYPVWMSDIQTLDEALEMILGIGELVDRKERAAEICNTIQTNFKQLKKTVAEFRIRTCAYFIWKSPYMAAGPNTFIDAMLAELHLKNVCESSRYPEVTLEDLHEMNPEVVLLSSEPYPFSEKHLLEIQSVLPNSKILLVDGEMFSWYGSRLQYAPQYFNEILVKLAIRD